MISNSQPFHLVCVSLWRVSSVQHVDVLHASVTLHDHPLLLTCLDGEDHSFLFVVVAEIFDQLLPRHKLHLLLRCTYCLQGGGADTFKFNLHIIVRVKKGCEFNQKRYELKNFLCLWGCFLLFSFYFQHYRFY